MNVKIKKLEVKKLVDFFERYKFVLLVIALGAVLLMIPWQSDDSEEASQEVAVSEDYSLKALQEQIQEALMKINGAGECTLVLTLKTSTEKVLAKDEELSSQSSQEDGRTSVEEESVSKTVIISGDSEEAVVVKTIYPEFQGALVVSEGADSAKVRLEIVNALTNLTGLGADKITVSKMTTK